MVSNEQGNTPISISNPLISITLKFKDGAALRQVFNKPVPQVKAIAAFGQLVAELGEELNVQAEEVSLTPREIEVLKLIAQGHPNKIIASELGVTEQTIKNHVTGIITKFEANNRTHAVIIAKDRGIL